MPLVDADDNEIDITEPWCLQTAQQQVITNQLIEAYREELEYDLGKFTTRNMPSGRVLVEPPGEDPLIAYLHDPKEADPRLVLDDFTPEIWEEWYPAQPGFLAANRNRKMKQI